MTNDVPRTRADGASLADALQAQPFTLAMSSGFFGFFAHAGFVAALESFGLQPAAYAGSSAGALVAAAHASGHSGMELRERFGDLRRDDFWDPRALPIAGGVLRGRRFRAQLRDLLAPSFRSLRPLSISVFDMLTRSTRVRRSGDLPLAVHASCCVPLMFEPVWDGRRPLLDGGIADRPGLAGVPIGARVLYHHIASRSPWRSHKGMRIPEREGMISVSIDGLPRLGPSRLDQALAAFDGAYEAGRRSLEGPAADRVWIRA
ncbi:MAG: patatin-like phospholipase family protein [Myxococcota bacterium]